MIKGKRYLLGDTGATHELRGVKSFDSLPRTARVVNLETATGVEEARMVQDVVYVLGEHIQPLFPLGTYIEELGLHLDWSSESCVLHLPDHSTMELLRQGNSIYVDEDQAQELRELKGAVMA